MIGDSGLIVGNCRLGEVIGRGGQGTVYRARQLGLDRPVAVKLVPVTLGDRAEVARFEREARMAGALDHPNCLPVYAAGEDQGLLYLVMRLVDGPDLAQLVQSEGPIDPERAVSITAQVASALDSAHRAGLIHRDLKPANILIDHQRAAEHAWVSDFGLMRSAQDRDQITMAGQWVGTPQFAAPEQHSGREVGPGADVYALGGVLSYMLGPRPSAPLQAVIRRALAEDPAGRYPSAGALAAAAQQAISRAGATRRGRAKPPAAAPTVNAGVDQPLVEGAEARRWAPRRGAVWAVAASLLCAAAVIVVVVALTGGHPAARGSAGEGSSGNGLSGGHGRQTLTTSHFTAAIPHGWILTSPETAMNGYTRTVVQSPTAVTSVDIDRTPHSSGTLQAHESSVERAVARTTPGYREGSEATIHDGRVSTIVWSFTIPGAQGSRVDVFRQIGASTYAVLGKSNSLPRSRSAATSIADSLRAR